MRYLEFLICLKNIMKTLPFLAVDYCKFLSKSPVSVCRNYVVIFKRILQNIKIAFFDDSFF